MAILTYGNVPVEIDDEMAEPSFAQGCFIRAQKDGIAILFAREAIHPAPGGPQHEGVAHVWIRPERFHTLVAQFKAIVEDLGGTVD